MPSQPHQVGIGGGDVHKFPLCSLRSHLLGAEHLGTAPTMNLRMTIGKGDSAGASMIPSRDIRNNISRHVDGKLPVINTVIAFIDENESVARAHPHQVATFAKSDKASVPGDGAGAHPNTH